MTLLLPRHMALSAPDRMQDSAPLITITYAYSSSVHPVSILTALLQISRSNDADLQRFRRLTMMISCA